MVDVRRKMVCFPLHIRGDVLDGEQRFSNVIDGGIIKLDKLGIPRSKLFGGNVEIVGMIRKYGIYACPHYQSRSGELIGFLANSWNDLTKDGQRVISAYVAKEYPGYELVQADILPPEIMTDGQKAAEAEIKERARAAGVIPSAVKTLRGAELLEIIKAKESGRAEGSVPGEPIAQEAPDSAPEVKRRHPRRTLST